MASVGQARVRISNPATLEASDYPSGEAALRTYLARLGKGERPRQAVIAAAGPIQRGTVAFTNNRAWRFSEADLAKAGDFRHVRLINDFTAQALAIAHLSGRDARLIGPRGKPVADSVIAVIGPGTGFGVAARAPGGAVLASEGGHMGFAPGDEVEAKILADLSERFERVSIERILSGSGLVNIYEALGRIVGALAVHAAPEQITRAALSGDPLARRAVERFCAILGAVAGDFALAFGARRGVYIAGGIAPGLIEILAGGDFRRRFEAKGRMSDYVRAIPTRVVMAPHAALIGAASLMAQDRAR